MNEEYFRAVKSGDLASVVRYLDQGIDPNGRDAKGHTALHYAVGNVNMVLALIQHGADVNARLRWDDATNLSVLQVAAQNNQLECARILIDYGADIEAKDENGVTALWDAMEFVDGHITSPAVARLLVERGADMSTGFIQDLYNEGDERFGRFDTIDELVRRSEVSF